MADLVHFELVSPERLLVSRDVYMVVVPGTEGDFGVLPGHAPLMSTIRPGAIAIYPASMNDVPERIFIDGGFAEVSATGLTILAESATPVSELDVEGAAGSAGGGAHHARGRDHRRRARRGRGPDRQPGGDAGGRGQLGPGIALYRAGAACELAAR